MSKRFVFLFLLLSSVLLVTACNDNDELSGKTFEVAYTPVLQEEIDNPSNYKPIMTLNFLNDNAVTNTIGGEEGEYKFADDVLVVNFKNEKEKLEIKFIDFIESDKDFSAYSSSIGDAKLTIEDTEQISRLNNLSSKITKDMPIEFIEK
ncbi:hypothetical protein D8M04_03910 [Oceanobacillus piezotolerans]|uniref:DUF4825 domain-containing protein n=1 Tax=Oceanobacillus piezotolerans TaxID=2448030 RepID=A0A498DFU8_9BACI|nr:hypothetical protein [Oceanobacillus piezotolerans]RLL48415.1 hypothetical protein D8M04_03910 [Oceanobacillus piezotolerans]